MIFTTSITRINITTVPERIMEYYEHPVGKWSEKSIFNLMNEYEPKYTVYQSLDSYMDQADGKHAVKTQVIEITGGGSDHRTIIKDPFVHGLIASSIVDDLQEFLSSTDFTIFVNKT